MNCQKCNQQLPYFRRPDSPGQLLTGGWTCPHCKTVLDSQGREIVGPYKTAASLLLLTLLYGGIALCNYLVFFRGRSGLGMLTLGLTLALVFGFLRVTRPRVRPHNQSTSS
jgi:hypothetical protein